MEKTLRPRSAYHFPYQSFQILGGMVDEVLGACYNLRLSSQDPQKQATIFQTILDSKAGITTAERPTKTERQLNF